jgi:hypothetical protein
MTVSEIQLLVHIVCRYRDFGHCAFLFFCFHIVCRCVSVHIPKLVIVLINEGLLYFTYFNNLLFRNTYVSARCHLAVSVGPRCRDTGISLH